MAIKEVKKVLNIEKDLSSTDFISQKMGEVTKRIQNKYSDKIVKVTTLCVQDKQLVISCTEESKIFMGAPSIGLNTPLELLSQQALNSLSLVTLDNEMINTYELILTFDSTIPDYTSAINAAQAKADEIFEENDTKIPLVTVIDYRWGNPNKTISASIFGEEDPEGKVVPYLNGTATINITGGNINGDLGFFNPINFYKTDALVADNGLEYKLLMLDFETPAYLSYIELAYVVKELNGRIPNIAEINSTSINGGPAVNTGIEIINAYIWAKYYPNHSLKVAPTNRDQYWTIPINPLETKNSYIVWGEETNLSYMNTFDTGLIDVINAAEFKNNVNRNAYVNKVIEYMKSVG